MRYYRISVQPSLFGSPALVREWGRIGRRSRLAITLHDDEIAAHQAFDTILRTKVRKGYVVADSGLTVSRT